MPSPQASNEGCTPLPVSVIIGYLHCGGSTPARDEPKSGLEAELPVAVAVTSGLLAAEAEEDEGAEDALLSADATTEDSVTRRTRGTEEEVSSLRPFTLRVGMPPPGERPAVGMEHEIVAMMLSTVR